jgi:hypothetical protein
MKSRNYFFARIIYGFVALVFFYFAFAYLYDYFCGAKIRWWPGVVHLLISFAFGFRWQHWSRLAIKSKKQELDASRPSLL